MKKEELKVGDLVLLPSYSKEYFECKVVQIINDKAMIEVMNKEAMGHKPWAFKEELISNLNRA